MGVLVWVGFISQAELDIKGMLFEGRQGPLKMQTMIRGECPSASRFFFKSGNGSMVWGRCHLGNEPTHRRKVAALSCLEASMYWIFVHSY
mgnify:CR=1 FL=1